MADTLFDAVLATARVLGGMVVGTATGGTTSTIIDTTRRTEDDDYWNGGLAMIVTDAGGASAAPEGEWGRITDFANSSNTVTIETLTAAPAASDTYALTRGRFSLDKLLNGVNTVLTGLKVPALDTTSLDTANNQTEYDLPAAVTRNNLRRVRYQTQTGDANDNLWHELRDWHVLRKATGTQDVLVLSQLTADRDIMLEYVTIHPAGYTASTSINEAVHLDRIKWAAAELIMAQEISWRDNFKNAANMANYFAEKAKEAEAMHPIILPTANSRLQTYKSDTSGEYTGEVGSVRL